MVCLTTTIPKVLETEHLKNLFVQKQIGQLKKDQNVAVFQLDRWKNVFNSRPEWAASMGVNEEFVAQLFKLIHDDSIKVQSEIVDKKETVA